MESFLHSWRFLWLCLLSYRTRKLLIKKELTKLSLREQKSHSEVTWDDDVLEFLTGGFNTKFGARSLQNVVQKKVVPALCRLRKEKEPRDICLSVEGESVVAKIKV